MRAQLKPQLKPLNTKVLYDVRGVLGCSQLYQEAPDSRMTVLLIPVDFPEREWNLRAKYSTIAFSEFLPINPLMPTVAMPNRSETIVL